MYQLLFLCVITVASLADGFPGFQRPYGFDYNVRYPSGGQQHRQESGSGGTVHGSYGYTDSQGLHRQVQYVADQGGFRAKVKTNEPGTASQDPASVSMMSSAHPYFGSHGGSGYAGQSYGGQSRGYAQEWEKAAAEQGMSGQGGSGYFSKFGQGF